MENEIPAGRVSPTRRIAVFLILSSLALVARADESAGEAAKPWDHGVPFAQFVRDAAKASNVRPELLHALIRAESGYRPGARSSSGAMGLMQLMPGVLKRYNVRDPLDPKQNIRAGARYVRELLDRFEDDVSLVLAAYNAGEYAVIRYGNRIPPFGQTRVFVPRVKALYDKFVTAAAADGASGD